MTTFIKSNTLSSEKAEGAKYGNVAESIKSIIAVIPKDQAMSLSDIVAQLMEKTGLPKRQAYTRMNHVAKTEWFNKDFTKRFDGGRTYICRVTAKSQKVVKRARK